MSDLINPAEGDSPAAPSFLRTLVHVPVGHILPGGEAVKTAFDVTVEYGARWHPDWPEPRVSVMAFRFLHHGDAIGFSGDRATAFPLDEFTRLLAPMHGRPIGTGERIYLEGQGLSIPTEREPIAAFVARPAGRLH